MTKQQKLDAIFSVPLKQEIVSVPEWGFDVIVRGMTGEARGRWMKAVGIDGKQALVEVLTCIETIVDPDTNELMFRPTDRDTLSKTPGEILGRLSAVGMRLSGLSAGDVTDAEKN